MQSIPCTGAKVDDMIDTQILVMDPDQRFVSLSIGGNNLDFSRILKACIFKPAGPLSEDCDTVLDEVRQYIMSGYRDTLRKAWDAVFQRLVNDQRRQVVVVFYPNFFNVDTDWCDEQTMGLVFGFQPLLDKALRQKLNALGDMARLYTIAIGQQYVADKRASGAWTRNRLFSIDGLDEEVYPNHRFCEAGVETLDNEDIYFFTIGGNDSPKVTVQDLLSQYDPKTCASDPKFKNDTIFGWYCVQYVTLQHCPLVATTSLPSRLKVLKKIDVIWGDVKPENVIVDVEDNVWIVDLGEGFTPPWKTPAERNTKAGDLKAVKLMVQYLETGDLPEMPAHWESGCQDTQNEIDDNGEPEQELQEETQLEACGHAAKCVQKAQTQFFGGKSRGEI